MADIFLGSWIVPFGIREFVQTDDGPQFVRIFLVMLYADVEVKHLPTTAYHLQTIVKQKIYLHNSDAIPTLCSEWPTKLARLRTNAYLRKWRLVAWMYKQIAIWFSAEEYGHFGFTILRLNKGHNYR